MFQLREREADKEEEAATGPRRSKRIKKTREKEPEHEETAVARFSIENEDDAEQDDTAGLSITNEDESSEDFPDDAPDDEEPEEEEDVPEAHGKPPPNMEMRSKFKTFVEEHPSNFLPFTDEEKTQIRLLSALKRKKAPLNAYRELLEWHLKEIGKLQPHETIKDASKHFDWVPTVAKLVKRYNLEGLRPVPKSVYLPFSKSKVTVPCVDAKAAIVALLTDPRFKAEDYLFFGDDPRAPPPDQIDWIKDLNTGEAYLRS